jgi:undecaprenyl-diphosphatase
MPGLFVVNPQSGRTNGSIEEISARFDGHDVEECEPDQLAAIVGDAVERGVDFVGVSGGDGSIRAAAEVLRGGPVPLLPVPGGTRNHFARQLGLPDLDAISAALEHPTTRQIDLGSVNGSCFVNNASIGSYSELVRRRDRYHRVPKKLATAIAAARQLRHDAPCEVVVDGTPRRVWMVFVGNNRYGDNLLNVALREALDRGELDVGIVRADVGKSRLRLLATIATGGWAKSPSILRSSVERVTIEVDAPTVAVALDGDVEDFAPPLVFESLPAALTVMVGGDQ